MQRPGSVYPRPAEISHALQSLAIGLQLRYEGLLIAPSAEHRAGQPHPACSILRHTQAGLLQGKGHGGDVVHGRVHHQRLMQGALFYNKACPVLAQQYKAAWHGLRTLCAFQIAARGMLQHRPGRALHTQGSAVREV